MFDAKLFGKYQKFFEVSDCGIEDDTTPYILSAGSGNIVVSAPHSTDHYRNGMRKTAEPQTGALAMLLHEQTDCHMIARSRAFRDDPNHDAVNAYKDALGALVRLQGIEYALDLHQLSDRRAVRINIGTGNGKNVRGLCFVEIALEAFKKRKIEPVQIDKPFAGAYEHTVSSFLSRECGVQSLQIEMNSALFESRDVGKTELVYDALEEIVRTVQGV